MEADGLHLISRSVTLLHHFKDVQFSWLFLGYIKVKKKDEVRCLTTHSLTGVCWCSGEIRGAKRPLCLLCLRPFRLLLNQSCFYSGLHGLNPETLMEPNWSAEKQQLDANRYNISTLSNSLSTPWHLPHNVNWLSKNKEEPHVDKMPKQMSWYAKEDKEPGRLSYSVLELVLTGKLRD